jgi:hypothetical protein
MTDRRTPATSEELEISIHAASQDVSRYQDAYDRECARKQLRAALKRGLVAKADTCEWCGNKPHSAQLIHAHHKDYSLPLSVEWICRRCHNDHHGHNAPVVNVGWAKWNPRGP